MNLILQSNYLILELLNLLWGLLFTVPLLQDTVLEDENEALEELIFDLNLLESLNGLFM